MFRAQLPVTPQHQEAPGPLVSVAVAESVHLLGIWAVAPMEALEGRLVPVRREPVRAGAL